MVKAFWDDLSILRSPLSFFDICDELPDITWEKAFLLLLDTFLDIAAEKYFLADDEVEYLLGAFVDALPEPLKNSILRCA